MSPEDKRKWWSIAGSVVGLTAVIGIIWYEERKPAPVASGSGSGSSSGSGSGSGSSGSGSGSSSGSGSGSGSSGSGSGGTIFGVPEPGSGGVATGGTVIACPRRPSCLPAAQSTFHCPRLRGRRSANLGIGPVAWDMAWVSEPFFRNKFKPTKLQTFDPGALINPNFWPSDDVGANGKYRAISPATHKRAWTSRRAPSRLRLSGSRPVIR